MAATLLLGGEDRESAKRRRKDAYRADLELQMKEKNAARIRERLQGMNVDASGWLDPEKRPERFKPLGGVHWTEQRSRRDPEVKPYHSLFLYGRVPNTNEQVVVEKSPRPTEPHTVYLDRPTRLVEYSRRVHLDPPAVYHPVTYAGAGPAVPNSSVDQAYNFYATRNLENGGGGGSIVQPISIPYVDNRPIIITGQNGGGGYNGPRFNPFEHRDDSSLREVRTLLGISQMETERMRTKMERDHDDFQRKLRQQLEDERRKLQDQEAEARRRMEEMRRDAEERRKEAERQRREAERMRKEAETRPKTDPPRPASKTMLYYDMGDYRMRLIDERRKIEELLKAGPKKDKDIWDIKVLHRPRIPPTPRSADRANRDNVREFNELKYRTIDHRNEFRNIFPDVPYTNHRLEQQQIALLRQQEAALRNIGYQRPRKAEIVIPPRRAVSRPEWLDRDPTPLPHRLRQRDKLWTAQSWDGDLDRIRRRNEERERVMQKGKTSSRLEEDVLDELKLRRHRPASADTLTDDTWLRPSDTNAV